MSSLLKAVIGYCKSLGKRGELRNDDVLLAPKLSSSSRILKFLSSRVLPCEPIKSSLRGDNRGQAIFELGKNKLIRRPLEFFALQKIGVTVLKIGRSLDDCLRNRGMTLPTVILGQQSVTRVSKGIKWTLGASPRVTKEKKSPRVTKEKKSPRVTEERKSSRVTLREECPRVMGEAECSWMTSFKQGMTLVGLFLCLFFLFPFSSNAAIYFLPDAQVYEVNDVLSASPMASIDSMRCEEVGYTYYASGVCPAYHNQETCVFNDKYLKCDAEGWCRDNSYTISSCSSPKIVDTQCPNNFALYKYCVCPSTYKYACTGTGYSSGNGTVCESKYTKCNCSTNYVWSGSACVCDSAFKYSCSGTGYSSGSGASCGGKYKSCNCSTYYSWNGSACAHVHSYVCPSGYSESKTGMISPASAAKVCQLSGCSSTSGTCYKETHSHSYSCPSGYSTSNAGMAAYVTASKSCSCGATSGTCYKSTHVHSYYCPSGTYTSSSSCSAGTDGTVAKVCSCGATTTETCYKCKHVHSYSCPSGSYSSSYSCIDGTSGTVSKVCSCGATSGTCYKCAAHYCSYSCPSGSYESSSSCSYGTSGTTYKTCRCGATNYQTCYTCNPPPHTHSYYCYYSTSTSGMVDPEKIPLECSCGLTQDGECYKDNHICDRECPSGYTYSYYSASPCPYGYSSKVSAFCPICGFQFGGKDCYKCYASGRGGECPEEVCAAVGGTLLEDGTCSDDDCERYVTNGCCESSCAYYGGEYIYWEREWWCTKWIPAECPCGEEL